MIALILIAIPLCIYNFIEGYEVWEDGWRLRHILHLEAFNCRFLCYLAYLIALPGMIAGYLLGLIMFRWTDWWF